jgi:hypothetical protein
VEYEHQFRHSLQLGLGRAILYAREHDVSAFRDVILDACLHCSAYDVQVEGTHAAYMQELTASLPDSEYYCEEVLKSLALSGDDWDAVQRFHFAACLAFDGSHHAKRSMYESYNPGPKMGEVIAIDFLKMDGIKGLLFVAEKIGELLTIKPKEVDQGWLLSQSLEICGEQETWDALQEAGAHNSKIETYRLAAAADHARNHSVRPEEVTPASYEELRLVLPGMKHYVITRWGQGASNRDIEEAARALIEANDPKERLLHLRIFGKRTFPLDPGVLMRLVDCEDRRIGFAALKALSQLTHPSVRNLAFRMTGTRAKWRGRVIGAKLRSR